MLYSRSMGRIIAIDYGRKRTGIAATDILQMIANGVATVPSGEVVKYLSDYISREPVDLFVVGLPKQMNNEPSENMKYVEACQPDIRSANGVFTYYANGNQPYYWEKSRQ